MLKILKLVQNSQKKNGSKFFRGGKTLRRNSRAGGEVKVRVRGVKNPQKGGSKFFKGRGRAATLWQLFHNAVMNFITPLWIFVTPLWNFHNGVNKKLRKKNFFHQKFFSSTTFGKSFKTRSFLPNWRGANACPNLSTGAFLKWPTICKKNIFETKERFARGDKSFTKNVLTLFKMPLGPKNVFYFRSGHFLQILVERFLIPFCVFLSR